MTEINDEEKTRRDVRTLDSGALRALAHPVRVRLYDILSQQGPQTASSLAAMTGESSGSTSYHLRALAKHDLIREIPDRGTARERWWERPSGGVSFPGPDSLRTPAGRAATQVVMGEFLDRRHEQLMRFVGTTLRDELDPWAENALITSATVSLTAAQLGEVNARIQRVIDDVVDEYRVDEAADAAPSVDRRIVSLRAEAFPITTESD
ncbi:ArsR family transcriptional regulator [Microbacterium sp. AISO3]|jgi:DNA-binding transcriptional ArsR family regulator|uniref:DNA-binding transcriptional ArsR family regulator n=1 Tax=Microbacterium paludicola TaxID=300019 RepID=A0ABU1HXI8_9MICO|nr:MULTISPECIES: helix-turn-helix domain-containing protein [Microbacterium]APF35612.1 transcriptional regulator [Microbacterium paludicola]MDR6166357.1 DNA-binding transcriptional ArsR family regulator [Microbacterium paludicola]OWP22873.1 ArsR family transcriptional regulator [Microbacterium sp. AISO3]POX67000.1 ArsR family transcriptional regulator [Microbacterium sp. Ru50]QCR41943.1 ArsR family transcriptional regulator [Microbacterium sp. SGAir0570]